MVDNDEDLAKETLTEAQETAGFHEAPQRLAIGGHFNHMLLWNVVRKDGEGESTPSGKLLEQINKQFTSFEGLKESFRKAVMSRVLPGWVWLGVGLSKSKDLVITQTNNEDNPLMGGVAEPQCTPIMGIDLWEHAYFSQFKGDKAAYC
jgi:Fe-Mn family superoxide dismutase